VIALQSIDGFIALLGDHNARVVVLGAAALGGACGLLGTFLTLRRRALLGDAISHAALPGVAGAYLVGVALAPSGSMAKSLPLLLAGGAAASGVGLGVMLILRRATTLRDDAILATVLSVTFGLGVVLLSVVQSLPMGHSAGLEGYIYGRVATMIASDAWIMTAAATAVVAAVIALAKEWSVLCFDESFARSIGLRTALLDAALMAMAIMVTVVGMQAVGLILVVAMQVIPPAAARCWTDRLSVMLIVAAGIGAFSAVIGSLISAAAPGWPSGALIVLSAAICLGFSLAFGSTRGGVWRAAAAWRLSRSIAVEHLLRALYEETESAGGDRGVGLAAILARRRFRPRVLTGAVRRARRAGLVRLSGDGLLRLTDAGLIEATRLTARHRLWEHYLIEQAGISASHVDRDADLVEHVLSPQLLARIQRSLGVAASMAVAEPPRSPHPLGTRAPERLSSKGQAAP